MDLLEILESKLFKSESSSPLWKLCWMLGLYNSESVSKVENAFFEYGNVGVLFSASEWEIFAFS